MDITKIFSKIIVLTLALACGNWKRAGARQACMYILLSNPDPIKYEVMRDTCWKLAKEISYDEQCNFSKETQRSSSSVLSPLLREVNDSQ